MSRFEREFFSRPPTSGEAAEMAEAEWQKLKRKYLVEGGIIGVIGLVRRTLSGIKNFRQPSKPL